MYIGKNWKKLRMLDAVMETAYEQYQNSTFRPNNFTGVVKSSPSGLDVVISAPVYYTLDDLPRQFNPDQLRAGSNSFITIDKIKKELSKQEVYAMDLEKAKVKKAL